MEEKKAPKVVHDPKTGKFWFSTNWIRVNLTSKKVRLLEKYDITFELQKVLDRITEQAYFAAKKNRVTDEWRKIVVLCGSTKFKAEFEEMNQELTLKGHIVLSVGAFPHADNHQSGEDKFGVIAKAKLDETHKCKIDLADMILIINKDGYIGRSTMDEFIYAKSLPNKIIIFYDDEKAQDFLKLEENEMSDIEFYSPSEADVIPTSAPETAETNGNGVH